MRFKQLFKILVLISIFIPLSLSSQEPGKDTINASYFNKMGEFYLRSDPGKAKEAALKAIYHGQQKQQVEEVARALHIYGEANYQLAQYDSAMDYFIQSMELYESLNNSLGKAWNIHNIGLIDKFMGKPEKALLHFHHAKNLFESQNDSVGIARCLLSIAGVHYEKEKYDLALEFCNKSLDFITKNKDTANLVAAYNNLGIIYKSKKNYALSHDYYTRSLEIKKVTGDIQGMIKSYLNLAILLMEQDKQEEAQKYLDEGLTFAKKLGNKNLIMQYYENLTQSYEDEGNYEKALESYKNYMHIQNELYSLKNLNKIAELEKEMEKEKGKIDQIDDVEDKLNKSEILWILIFSYTAVLVFFLLYLISLFKRNRQNQAYQKTLEHEINQHKQTLKSLQINEERLSLALKGANDGIWDIDLHKKEIFVSAKTIAMMGYYPKELGKNFKLAFDKRLLKLFIHPQDSNEAFKALDDHLNGTNAFLSVSFRLRQKDGSYFWVHCRGKMLENEEDGIYRIVGTIRNIDETKKMQEKLTHYRDHLEELIQERTEELNAEKKHVEEASRSKSNFINNLSHQIRTPLNAIVGFTELLNAGHLKEKEKKNIHKYIINNGNTLLYLIDELADMSLIESDELYLFPVEFTLNDTIEEIWQMQIAKHHLDENIKLVLNAPGEEINIKTDKQRLKQVLTNVIDNAFKFTHEGKIELKYRIEQHPDNRPILYLTLEDTGSGIPYEELESVFERFSRTPTTSEQKTQGTGLGLYITRKILQKMQGNIWFETEPGQGTKFHITLPVDIIQHIGTKPTENESDQPQNWEDFSILIAEDEYSNYKVLETILRRTKVNVIYAQSGKAAIEEIDKKQKIDLAIIDIKMPEIDGLEVTKYIKEKRPNVPVILNTAFASADDQREGKELGADEYLTKPVKAKKLLSTLQKLFMVQN